MTQLDRQICVIANNIRSLWNVGSLFRTSDAFAIQKLYLTGYTATPPRREINKTAIGAEEWIPWEYHENASEVITTLQSDGWAVVALELTDTAIDIVDFEAPSKVALLLGHEVTGVPDELLKLANTHVQIPMLGKKQSLNVSVAAGVALHALRT